MSHNSLEHNATIKIILFYMLIYSDIHNSVLDLKKLALLAKQCLFYAIICVKKGCGESICCTGKNSSGKMYEKLVTLIVFRKEREVAESGGERLCTETQFMSFERCERIIHSEKKYGLKTAYKPLGLLPLSDSIFLHLLMAFCQNFCYVAFPDSFLPGNRAHFSSESGV